MELLRYLVADMFGSLGIRNYMGDMRTIVNIKIFAKIKIFQNCLIVFEKILLGISKIIYWAFRAITLPSK